MKNKTKIFDKNGNRLSILELINLLPSIIPLKKVNRVEVIDENGRSYTNYKNNNKTKVSFQDNNKTLKIFISNKEKNE